MLATRAMDALVAAENGGPVAVFARPWAAALWAERWPAVTFHAAPAGGGLAWLGAGPLRRLRARAIVLFPPSLSARLHAAWAGVPRRLGLTGEAGHALLTHHAPRGARGTRHLEDEYLDLARLAGAAAVPRHPLAPAAAARAAADALLAAAGVAADAPLLLVAPGARYGPAKRWPAERFAECARAWLGAHPGGAIALVGESADALACARVAAALPMSASVFDLSGRTSLAVLLALAARASAALSNDSGFAHLAAACDRPTAVVFGSTDPRWTAPRGARVAVVARPPACSPCFERACIVPERYACMDAVGVADVARALARVEAGEDAA